MQKTLNKQQAIELFEKEAIFFGTDDGVPLTRIQELFGFDTAEFAFGFGFDKMGVLGNIFCIKNNEIQYLNRKGFFRAVGYANATLLCGKQVKE